MDPDFDPGRLPQIDGRIAELIRERIAAVRARLAPPPTDPAARAALRRDLGVADPGARAIADPLVARLLTEIARSTVQAVVPDRVAYLGPEFSYSYLAATGRYGLAAEYVPVGSIAAVFEAVERGDAGLGVVPIENSTDGRIVDTLGILARRPATLVGEISFTVHHCLVGQGPRSAIREVHSKPQALSQCRRWLATHLPGARLVEAVSTTGAAREASRRGEVAAVAAAEAGRALGLDLLAENIEDNPDNVTRFAVIGRDAPPPTGRDKTVLMMRLPHTSGALAKALTVFHQAGLNLTWIESFPLPDAAREYLFFVEFEGHRADAGVRSALAALERVSERVTVLGSFPRDVAAGT